MTGKIRVGTSGWSYDDWRPAFYPEGMGKARWLDYYVTRFDTVEINATFYRLPAASTVEKWRGQAATEFEFAVKGSRYITHQLRLRASGEAVRNFTERIRPLGAALGVVLWQLPPNLQRDLLLLGEFAAALPREIRHAIEFRHESWLEDGTYEVLEDHGVALVAVSSLQIPPVKRTTAEFGYVRLHGLVGGWHHDYSTPELEPWAEFAAECAESGKDCFVYFNNDGDAHAPANAETFIDLVAARL